MKVIKHLCGQNQRHVGQEGQTFLLQNLKRRELTCSQRVKGEDMRRDLG
jgi:hypothetical protein